MRSCVLPEEYATSLLYDQEYQGSIKFADQAEFTLVMKRDVSEYWLTLIGPHLCVLLTGFTQFYIPPGAVPARAAIMAVSILSMLGIRTATESIVPEGINWMSTFQVVCLVVLLVSAIVSVLSIDSHAQGIVRRKGNRKRLRLALWYSQLLKPANACSSPTCLACSHRSISPPRKT